MGDKQHVPHIWQMTLPVLLPDDVTLTAGPSCGRLAPQNVG